MNQFAESCRTCLKQSDQKMKPLTSKCDESVDFWAMLISFIEMEEIQGVPLSICCSCEAALISSYRFKQMCLETEAIVKQIVETNERQLADDSKCIEESLHWDHVERILETEDCPKVDEIVEETIEANAELNVDCTAIEPDVECDGSISKSTNSHRKNSSTHLCRICNVTFNLAKDYQTHYRQLHRVSVLCPLCGKLIPKHSMEKHRISHTKTKDHLCTECGKSFTLDENLKKHWRIHRGDKRYTCEHCGERFIHWNSKRSHIRAVHTGEKNYECNICGKKFAQSSNLFRHIRQHTGELRHECDFCQKKFMTTTELRNHVVVHTKEKNEICEICHKAFGTRKAMRTHLKIHTGERNYVCMVCSKAFTQAHVLRSHMKTHPDCPIPPPGVRLAQKQPPNGVKTISNSASIR